MAAMGIRIALLGALLAAAAAASAPARADRAQDDQRARELYKQGNVHYNLAEYDEAIEAFKAAYALTEAPALLFNIAQAYRLQGDCAQALRFYKNFARLEQAAPNREDVDALVREMDECAKNRAPAGPAPPAAEDVPPPLPEVVPAPAPPPRPDRPWYKDALGNALVLGGVAALVGGGLVWKSGRDAVNASERAMGYAEFERQADGAYGKQTVGVLVMGAGAALVAGGVLRLTLRARGDARAVSVTVTPGAGGATAGLAVRF